MVKSVKPIVKVLSGDEGYSISVNGVVSGEEDYGNPVEVEVDGVVYTGYVEVDEKGDLTTPFPEFVFIAQPVDSEVVEEGEDGDKDEDEPEVVVEGEQGEGEGDLEVDNED
jgi:hypothetical protein